jgi:hypothetical protein
LGLGFGLRVLGEPGGGVFLRVNLNVGNFFACTSAAETDKKTRTIKIVFILLVSIASDWTELSSSAFIGILR